MSHKSITVKIQNQILFNIQVHCMTVSDMIYHVHMKYPRVPDNIITDTIQMMIDENTLRVSFTVNGIDLYYSSKNQNLSQKIHTYLIQMNYSAAYDDIINAFGMTAQQNIADAIGVLVAKNIITKNQTNICITKIERENVLCSHQIKN